MYHIDIYIGTFRDRHLTTGGQQLVVGCWSTEYQEFFKLRAPNLRDDENLYREIWAGLRSYESEEATKGVTAAEVFLRRLQGLENLTRIDALETAWLALKNGKVTFGDFEDFGDLLYDRDGLFKIRRKNGIRVEVSHVRERFHRHVHQALIHVFGAILPDGRSASTRRPFELGPDVIKLG